MRLLGGSADGEGDAVIAAAAEERGDWREAAGACVRMGDLGRAAELLERDGDLVLAAVVRAQHLLADGDIRGAAEAFEDSGDPGEAAELWARLGDERRAAAAWGEAGQHGQAAETLRRLEDWEAELEQRELAGQWVRAGELRFAAADWDGAAAALKRIAEDSADWRSARILLGDVQHEQGLWADAAANYALALRDEPVDEGNVAVWYRAGVCAFEAGRIELATDQLERVQAFDADYHDIDELMARLSWLGRPRQQRPRLAAAVVSDSRRFERGDLLGEGASGAVYRARDTLLDREVAVKVLAPETASEGAVRERFLREARAAAGLSHPNIVAIYDFGVAAGELFLAMELVGGPTLRAVVRRDGPLSPLALRAVVEQACDALGYAHEKGVIHLDIKPANLLINPDGVLKITDFGLARWLTPGRSGELGDAIEAAAGEAPIGGTPFYMAPERILGERATTAVDIYALGVTLFELATGEVPFGEGDVLRAQVDRPAPIPSDLRPDLPPWIDRVVARCLRKDPSDRYPSAEALQAELQAAAA